MLSSSSSRSSGDGFIAIPERDRPSGIFFTTPRPTTQSTLRNDENEEQTREFIAIGTIPEASVRVMEHTTWSEHPILAFNDAFMDLKDYTHLSDLQRLNYALVSLYICLSIIYLFIFFFLFV
jgi:hypothetical protein